MVPVADLCGRDCKVPDADRQLNDFSITLITVDMTIERLCLEDSEGVEDLRFE